MANYLDLKLKNNCNDGDNVLTHYKKNQEQNNKKTEYWIITE